LNSQANKFFSRFVFYDLRNKKSQRIVVRVQNYASENHVFSKGGKYN